MVAVRDTVYVPEAIYVCEGFFSTDVSPSPNVHDHDNGMLPDASTNVTESGTVPDVRVALNAATGSTSVADTGRVHNSTTKITSTPVNAVNFFMDHLKICFLNPESNAAGKIIPSLKNTI